MKMLTTAFASKALEMMGKAARLMGLTKNTLKYYQGACGEGTIPINTAPATHLLKDVRLGSLILCVVLN